MDVLSLASKERHVFCKNCSCKVAGAARTATDTLNMSAMETPKTTMYCVIKVKERTCFTMIIYDDTIIIRMPYAHSVINARTITNLASIRIIHLVSSVIEQYCLVLHALL